MKSITVENITLEVPYLIEEARKARAYAYAPYSKFKVGAVGVDREGKFYSGANIENASYGLTCCAEQNAVFQMVLWGTPPLIALAVCGDTSDPVHICGACRQVIREFACSNTKIILSNLKNSIKILSMEEILPFSFGPEHLH